MEAGRYLVLRGRGLGRGAGMGVILTDLPSLTSLSTSMTSGEAARLTGLDTRLARGAEAGDAEAEVTRLEMVGVEAGDEEVEVTLLEMVAGLGAALPALTGGVLVTEDVTFLTLAAEEGVCLVCRAGVTDAGEPSISKLMSSRDTVSLLRVTLDLLTLDLL